MAKRSVMPITSTFVNEFLSPRTAGELPPLGEPAPDFELPYARFFVDTNGQERVEYGRTMRLSNQRGKPVVLDLTRIVSDRFF